MAKPRYYKWIFYPSIGFVGEKAESCDSPNDTYHLTHASIIMDSFESKGKPRPMFDRVDKGEAYVHEGTAYIIWHQGRTKDPVNTTVDLFTLAEKFFSGRPRAKKFERIPEGLVEHQALRRRLGLSNSLP